MAVVQSAVWIQDPNPVTVKIVNTDQKLDSSGDEEIFTNEAAHIIKKQKEALIIDPAHRCDPEETDKSDVDVVEPSGTMQVNEDGSIVVAKGDNSDSKSCKCYFPPHAKEPC